MPVLHCSVHDCKHYNDQRCCIGHIQVGGTPALQSETTCCESFDERSDGISYEDQAPTPDMSVDCEAVNCVFNRDNACTANEITIEGDDCHNYEETCCGSFYC